MTDFKQLLYTYADTYRHWCPLSEPYTGVDALISALREGWVINGTAYCQEFWRGGSRPVAVYYFELINDNDVVTMPVITNPYLPRIIDHYNVRIINAAPTAPTAAHA